MAPSEKLSTLGDVSGTLLMTKESVLKREVMVLLVTLRVVEVLVVMM